MFDKWKNKFLDINRGEPFFQRLRSLFWWSSILISVITFFMPMLIECAERGTMSGVEVVRGCEMVEHMPMLAVFVITAPILGTVIHTTEMPGEKKIIMYYALGGVYVVTYAVCILLTLIEIMNLENRIMSISWGAYLVFAANFIDLSIGVIPTIWMLEEPENSNEEEKK